MKNLNLILIAVVAVLVVILSYLIDKNIAYRNDNDRMRVNFGETLQDIRSMTITRNEFSELLEKYKDLDSTLRVEGIKIKNVQYVTRTEYVYVRDTVSIPVIRDSVYLYSFNYKDDCLSFGEIGRAHV